MIILFFKKGAVVFGVNPGQRNRTRSFLKNTISSSGFLSIIMVMLQKSTKLKANL
jgi:hypothetical protein